MVFRLVATTVELMVIGEANGVFKVDMIVIFYN